MTNWFAPHSPLVHPRPKSLSDKKSNRYRKNRYFGIFGHIPKNWQDRINRPTLRNRAGPPSAGRPGIVPKRKKNDTKASREGAFASLEGSTPLGLLLAEREIVRYRRTRRHFLRPPLCRHRLPRLRRFVRGARPCRGAANPRLHRAGLDRLRVQPARGRSHCIIDPPLFSSSSITPVEGPPCGASAVGDPTRLSVKDKTC